MAFVISLVEIKVSGLEIKKIFEGKEIDGRENLKVLWCYAVLRVSVNR